MNFYNIPIYISVIGFNILDAGILMKLLQLFTNKTYITETLIPNI